MKKIQVLEALGVVIECDDPAPSNATKVINIFKNTGKEMKKVKAHVKIVWAETPHGNTADQTL
eukprot:13081250-Ditylum_brightwellii.AAC.1